MNDHPLTSIDPALADKLARLPRRPGVYLHKDAIGKVLYVGKAKSLRNRVRSYFQAGRTLDGRLDIMVAKVVDVDVIVTETEAEALILENNLIKKLKPRYNINLRDDKSFPYVCIKNERFPRVFPTRRLRQDDSLYFGPYTNVKTMKRALGAIRSIFKLRTCGLNLTPESIAAGKFQVCLEYHIKKCAGPCVGYQTEAQYDETIRQVKQLLNGKTAGLVALLKDEMRTQAANLNFEEAAAMRDQVEALERYSEKQRLVSNDGVDRDVFALAMSIETNLACGVVFNVRDGAVSGSQHKVIKGIEGTPSAEVMRAFVERYYSEATYTPDEVLLSEPVEDAEALEALLRGRRGRVVPVRMPERGDKAGLMRIVEANARLQLEEIKLQRAKQEGRIPYAVEALQRDLRLENLPRHIECFDISHLGGTNTVASCVVFEDGKPRKKDYRTYKIRTTEEGTPDDFRSMREVVSRRYRRLLEEESPLPDLVVIDGGKGQLSSAVEALHEVGVYGQFPVVGLAKRLEEVYFPWDTDPVHIPLASASLQLLQKIRNEAHRFAITFQQQQRRKSMLRSELLDIPGVGEKSAKKLLAALGSVKRIRQASAEDLARVVGKSLGERIAGHFAAKRVE
jgi:excinuclease ABC subunit C